VDTRQPTLDWKIGLARQGISRFIGRLAFKIHPQEADEKVMTRKTSIRFDLLT